MFFNYLCRKNWFIFLKVLNLSWWVGGSAISMFQKQKRFFFTPSPRQISQLYLCSLETWLCFLFSSSSGCSFDSSSHKWIWIFSTPIFLTIDVNCRLNFSKVTDRDFCRVAAAFGSLHLPSPFQMIEQAIPPPPSQNIQTCCNHRGCSGGQMDCTMCDQGLSY